MKQAKLKSKATPKGRLDPAVVEDATTENKKQAALDAIGLWNDEPSETTDLHTIRKMAKEIREGAWQRRD